MIVDIAALSMSMAASQVNTDVGVAVLSKNMDLLEDMGDGLQKMMEMSVNPNVGANFDVSL